jgi:hypothetical protein
MSGNSCLINLAMSLALWVIIIWSVRRAMYVN